MFTAQIFLSFPHLKDSAHLVQFRRLPAVLPAGVAFTDSKPALIGRELAIDRRPPGRRLSKKTKTQMDVSGRAVPRAVAKPHIAPKSNNLSKADDACLSIDSRSLMGPHAIADGMPVKHPDAVEQAGLDNGSSGHLIAGNNRADNFSVIGNPAVNTDGGGDDAAGLNPGRVQHPGVGIDVGAGPGLCLVCYLAAAAKVDHAPDNTLDCDGLIGILCRSAAKAAESQRKGTVKANRQK